MKFIVFSLFLLFSTLSFAQNQIDPHCMRLEGLQLPCITGGQSEVTYPPPGCSGDVLPDKAACDQKICPWPIMIDGTTTTMTLGKCKAYSYQCSGSQKFDGCEISCQLQGSSCVKTKTAGCTTQDVTCEKTKGSCSSYEFVCNEKPAQCYNETEDIPGKAIWTEKSKCCKCPSIISNRCRTCG